MLLFDIPCAVMMPMCGLQASVAEALSRRLASRHVLLPHQHAARVSTPSMEPAQTAPLARARQTASCECPLQGAGNVWILCLSAAALSLWIASPAWCMQACWSVCYSNSKPSCSNTTAPTWLAPVIACCQQFCSPGLVGTCTRLTPVLLLLAVLLLLCQPAATATVGLLLLLMQVPLLQ